MAQASTLKSAVITNLDASPLIIPTAGEGAAGFLKLIDDYLSPLTADTTSSSYRLCRFPTNAKVKNFSIYSAVATAGSADINVIFSDSTDDGTQASLQNMIPTSALTGATTTIASYTSPNQLFGAAQSITALTEPTNYTFAGIFTPAMSVEPLWAALGFTTDPNGYFDIYLKVTTAITTGGVLQGRLEFVS